MRLLGRPETTGARRLALVEQAIDDLRSLDGQRDAPGHTPVLMAAAGPRARALAAAKADIVTLASIGPLTGRAEAARRAAEFRSPAGERAADIELAMPLFVIGDEARPGHGSSCRPTSPP